MRHIRNLGLTLAVLGALTAIFAGSALAAGPPVNTVKPVILGTPQFEYTLTSGKGIWTESPTSYGYQWLRCDSSGASCAAIAGATSASHMVEEADQGHTLAVEVTASNSFGSGKALSKATAVVKITKHPEFVPNGHVYPVHFSFRGSGGDINWGGGTVACGEMSGSGSITGPNQVSAAQLAISGCFGETITCTTIEATSLHGHFGYINEAAKTVGLVLETAGSPFASFKCKGSAATVIGAVIAKLTPVNTVSSSFNLAYSSSGGLQSPDKFEGGPVRQLEWSWLGRPYEDWGFEASDSLTTSEGGKIVG
jgi:hypothetical protein